MSPERILCGAEGSAFYDLWRPPQEAEGFAVFVHGGFWREKYDLSHANPLCAALADLGVVVANLEYRRVGQPGGGWPGTLEDVVQKVKAASARVGRVPVLVGHSAGGHLALRLASEELAMKAVVALAPVADLRLAYELNLSNGAVAEFMGGGPQEFAGPYDEACPSKHAAGVRRVLIHGTRDEDVPIEISRAYLRARQGDAEPPQLVEIPGAGHMELIDPISEAGRIVIEHVLRLVRE